LVYIFVSRGTPKWGNVYRPEKYDSDSAKTRKKKGLNTTKYKSKYLRYRGADKSLTRAD